MASREIKVTILGDSSSAQRALNDLDDTGGKVTGKFSGMAKKFSGMIGPAISGAIGGGVLVAGQALFELGTQMEQLDAKAATVFGDQLDVVSKWAKKSAADMGLTAREATGLAANFADLLIPMGFTREQAAGMSTDVVGLSGALSEWSGGQTSAKEASEILAKAMLGERDGLKALGISISEADVKGQLLKAGKDKLTGAALEQAKAEATAALIFAKSTDAQNAYATSTDDAASKQARMSARLGEVKESLAGKVQPALVKLGDFLVTYGIPALEKTGRFVGSVAGKFGEWSVKVEEVYGDVSRTIGGIISFVADAPDKISDAAKGMFDGIKQAFRSALNFIIRGWNALEFRIPGFKIGPVGYDGFTLGVPNIPYLASGGNITRGGMAMVGERGPELVSLPRGAKVTPLSADAGSSAGNVYNLHFNQPGTLSPEGVVQALRRMELLQQLGVAL